MNKNFLCLVELFIGLAFLVGASATALGEEFYKGKTIRFIVHTQPGGGYDTYTRAIARHIGKYIPGNPTPVVQNMPGGAGGLLASHYIYSKAEPDGLTVGVWNGALVLHKALGSRRVKFDARRFGWIGAPSGGSPACAIMGFTGLKTLKDVLNSKKPLKMGATRRGTTEDLPKILNVTLGTKFKVISRPGGMPRIHTAMQKREIDGICYGWESMRVTARSMLDAKGDNKLIPFLIQGKSQDPEVKNLPQLTEVIKGEKNQAMLKAYLLPLHKFQRPLSLPPGTPKERLNTLRKAFKATIEDPKFLAEAKKSKLIINYVSGEQIEKYVDQLLGISQKTKESLQFLVEKKKKKKK